MPHRRLSHLQLVSLAALAVAAGVVWPAAAAAAPAGRMDDAIERQVRAGRRVAPSLGIEVIDAETGESVYSHHPDRQRIIASNTKLFTTAAALDRLGPGFFFETRLLMRGTVADGTLTGDLAVVGGGDPNISGRFYGGDPYAVFRRWAASLRARGVRRVVGDVYLDYGLFPGPTRHPDWPERDRARWFQAPVAALSFSDNCVLVAISPNGHSGGKAEVEVTPDLPLFEVDNRAVTTGSARRHSAGVRRSDDGSRLTVFGAVWERAAPVETWVAVPDPVAYFGAALVDALREEGIEVGGRTLPVPRLPGLVWERVAVQRTDLLTAVQVTNKRSQNFYAESLLKTLGAQACGRGTWEGGVEAVAEFLEKIGIERGSYSMADGSGLSRNDRFCPRQVTRLLRAMHGHRWGREFMLSLPYSGEPELSWERRLARPPYAGNVYAKTGTILGVSSLSGYAKAVSGRLYVFSILANDVSSTWEARRLQDRIVEAIIDNG
jgi:D-alanyl-D-alanine carboxypeptidase/D-alanyl-D-alanine-endopeptidase (penicillin-binding protein 4)